MFIKKFANSEQYCDYGCEFFSRFIEENFGFNTEEFTEYVIEHNKADRDSGELMDISKEEVLRLADEFTDGEKLTWKCPNCGLRVQSTEDEMAERMMSCPKCGQAMKQVGEI